MMSEEARKWCGSSGMSLGLCIRFWVFFTLKAFGSGAIRWIFSVNSLDSLYARGVSPFYDWTDRLVRFAYLD